MKTISIWGYILLINVAVLSLNSCSDDDGDWEPMVWKAEVPVQKTGAKVYSVPETGMEFTFSCVNYSRPWIENAESNGEYYYPQREANDYHSITTDWFKANINDNILKVVFEPNETSEERPLQLTVTAGDIFYTFVFKQSANR